MDSKFVNSRRQAVRAAGATVLGLGVTMAAATTGSCATPVPQAGLPITAAAIINRDGEVVSSVGVEIKCSKIDRGQYRVQIAVDHPPIDVSTVDTPNGNRLCSIKNEKRGSFEVVT